MNPEDFPEEFNFEGFEGFDWDSGNRGKSWKKHGVLDRECEEIFYNAPLIIPDVHHSSREEPRFIAKGETDESRPLIVVFTWRGNLIRPISARPMNPREAKEFTQDEE
ncbi:MAG: BrnT family toxin [bacterium]